jgi:hypothetical protein
MGGGVLDDALDDIGPGKGAMRSWFFQSLAMSGDPNTPPPRVRDWSRFDYTLATAAAHGVKVIVTLTDQWGECGDGGANGFKTSSWYTGGYMATQPGLLTPYRDFVAEVVTRYKDDPTVLMWQLINEAEVKPTAAGGCLPGTQSHDTLSAWATDVSGLIKSIDPDHLVSLGTIGSGQCGASYTEYQALHAIPTIDVCEFHDYYDPYVPIPGDFWNGMQRRIDQCNALDKPLFVGELGIIPNNSGGTLAGRAAALQGKRDAQFGAGIDGILAWDWSSLGSTYDNYDIGPDDPVLETLILDDNCPSVTNPDQADGDSDGVGTACDNCPAVTNENQTNTDGDPLGDACDNCPTFATLWDAASNDNDCDGYANTTTYGARASEAVIGTDSGDGCADTTTPNDERGAALGEPEPPWVPDVNDNRIVQINDVLAVGAALNTSPPNPNYRARFDWNGNGLVTIADLLQVGPFLNKTCTP